MNFLEKLTDTIAMRYKAKKEIKVLKRINGYKASKWALPSIRKILQLLTYLRKNRLIWNLKKVVRLNKDILTKDEIKFIINLDKSVKKRKNLFTKKDKEISIDILNKLNHEILIKELSSII